MVSGTQGTLGALFVCISLFVPLASAQQADMAQQLTSEADEHFEQDENKSIPLLLEEAEQLFLEERPLDARSKLLSVLKKDKDNYQAHVLLSGYYLVHVGHFRLSLKYIKKAIKLFQEEHGRPPYVKLEQKLQHAHQLHLLSQSRLNLDNYDGALQALNEYEQQGYYQDWFPGSKAWVLMKQGKLDEAIKVARLGLLAGSEKGRTLNILGILLSMTGQREQSLRVFREAVAHELSLGTRGQPATPINNSGEVYREIYQEDKAESSWRKAISLPDGCEHVLPSLNLMIISMEQLDYLAAKRSIDNFESCIAQYPLRNGEEHRALVHLAKGRIDLRSGEIKSAIEHFQKTLLRRQWFGKIGASGNDLAVAALISYSEALKAKEHRLSFRLTSSFYKRVKQLFEQQRLGWHAWWLKRRAQQVLIEDLEDGEDLFVRHTDSLLDYATVGEALRGIDIDLLEEKIAQIDKEDPRVESNAYYQAYLVLANEGIFARSKKHSVPLSMVRKQYDDALKLRLLLSALGDISLGSTRYATVSEKIFRMSRPALINNGFRLPVNIKSDDSELGRKLSESAFIPLKEEAEHVIIHTMEEGLHSLGFYGNSGISPKITVRGSDLTDVINQLTDSVFRISLP